MAFLALENFLKAYLLLNGATLEHEHDLTAALNEAKARGLVLKVAPEGVSRVALGLALLLVKPEESWRSAGVRQPVNPVNRYRGRGNHSPAGVGPQASAGFQLVTMPQATPG